jgi:hypothetical protein
MIILESEAMIILATRIRFALDLVCVQATFRVYGSAWQACSRGHACSRGLCNPFK